MPRVSREGLNAEQAEQGAKPADQSSSLLGTAEGRLLRLMGLLCREEGEYFQKARSLKACQCCRGLFCLLEMEGLKWEGLGPTCLASGVHHTEALVSYKTKVSCKAPGTCLGIRGKGQFRGRAGMGVHPAGLTSRLNLLLLAQTAFLGTECCRSDAPIRARMGYGT